MKWQASSPDNDGYEGDRKYSDEEETSHESNKAPSQSSLSKRKWEEIGEDSDDCVCEEREAAAEWEETQARGEAAAEWLEQHDNCGKRQKIWNQQVRICSYCV